MPGNKADGGKMAVQPRRTRTRRQSRDCRAVRGLNGCAASFPTKRRPAFSADSQAHKTALWSKKEVKYIVPYFIAAQLRGIIKCGLFAPQTQKLFSKSCFPFIEDTMVNYADAPGNAVDQENILAASSAFPTD